MPNPSFRQNLLCDNSTAYAILLSSLLIWWGGSVILICISLNPVQVDLFKGVFCIFHGLRLSPWSGRCPRSWPASMRRPWCTSNSPCLPAFTEIVLKGARPFFTRQIGRPRWASAPRVYRQEDKPTFNLSPVVHVSRGVHPGDLPSLGDGARLLRRGCWPERC